MSDVALFAVFTFIASGIGTLTGFGTSTILVPLLLLFFPLPITLLFVGVIHWFGDIWKIILFRSGIRWRIVLLFGISGIIGSYIGASLVVTVAQDTLARLLGVFLAAYVGWLVFNPAWRLPAHPGVTIGGGALSGFLAGVFGVGGAVRGAFLTAYNLPKEVYLFTVGSIALIVDSTRIATYVVDGVRLSPALLWALVLCVPASLLGALAAKSIVGRISKQTFRKVVAVFLLVFAVKLIIWP